VTPQERKKRFESRLRLARAVFRGSIEPRIAAVKAGCAPSNVYQVLGAVLMRAGREGMLRLVDEK